MLFADLVGFTSLSERLDAEDVAMVQDEYFGAAREAIEARSGQVEKFIGDAVVGTFGVDHASDEDAEHAVAAGLAIVAALGGIEAALGLEQGTLQVRVGVNTGEVVVTRSPGQPGTWRVTGDVMNVAARLQAAAPPGSVLLGPDTALAVASAYSTDPAGPLDLKGKALPVTAWRVLERRAARSREAALHGLHASTVGRERELRLLEQSFRSAADSIQRWLIVAPPGVGKTRLLQELADQLGTAGAPVWTAKASATTSGRYELVAQLLREAIGPVAPGDEGRELVVERLASVGHTGPRAALSAEHTVALLTGGPLDAAPVDLWTSWTAVLDASAGGVTPVWLVEDLHQAGPDQLAFLGHCLAQPHRRGRMVVMTARPAIVSADGDSRLGGVPIVYLAPLSEAETLGLVESLVGPGVLPTSVAEAAARASGGNPLFVEEVLRSWVQAGALRRSDSGGWELVGPLDRLEIPNTIRAIYLGQLDDLPEVPRRVVEAGSVPGVTFPAGALPVLGVDDPDPALDLLIELGLLTGPHEGVVDPSSYTYRHALLRDTAYGVLARSARAQMHMQFAEWVVATLPPETRAEIVGEHLAAAYDEAPALGGGLTSGLRRDELRVRAAEWLERAGELTLTSAPQRAVQLVERALTLTSDDEPSVARRNLRMAEALRRSGRLDDAMRAFSRAGALSERSRDEAIATAAALGYEDSLFESRLPRHEWGPTGLKLLAAALEHPALDDAARSRLLAARGRAQVYAGMHEQGESTTRRAVEIARRSADDGALAYALLSLRAAQSGPEQLVDRLERIEELVDAASRAGDQESELEGVRLQLVDLLEDGDVASARACQQRAEQLIAALRQPLFLWYPAMWRAMDALFRGDLGGARELIEEFRVDGQRWHYRDVELVYAAQRAQLHAELGTPEEALPLIEAVASEERIAPNLAACFARAGRLDEAAAQLAVHASRDFTSLPQDLSLSYSLALETEAAAALGDAPASARLRTLLAPWDGHNIVLGSGALALGAASHFLGLAARTAGDVDDAITHLRAAVRMNDAIAAAPAAARSRLELARTLMSTGAAGPADEASQVARQGVDAARSIGMVTVADDLDRLLDGGAQR